MITYPVIKNNRIGVTAPSSGLEQEHHEMLYQAVEKMKERGFQTVVGQTPWTQHHAKSASAEKRAAEFMEMMTDSSIDAIIPPWGGELLLEIFEYLDFSSMQPKWVLGYSDISLLLLAITMNTGLATAHGTNLIDLRGKEMDPTTARWMDVLNTKKGETVVQFSSDSYQKQWDFENPSPVIFHLDEPTEWKTVSGREENFSGRLLGGCIDTIRHMIGTPFGNIKQFREKHIPDESIVWYLENCELTVADLKRSLTQMKYAGWFENCSGILFGRSAANQTTGTYTVEEMYADLSKELDLPVVYDIDCGHVPPQMTFVNGAFAEISVKGGKGEVKQEFR